MAFRPDSPIDLPGGRLGCGAHGLEVCPSCCVDYTFMDEVRSDSAVGYMEASDSDNQDQRHRSGRTDGLVLSGGIFCAARRDKVRLGTGQVMFEKFIPPKATDLPSTVFTPGVVRRISPPTVRFINNTDPTQLLLYTDGSCLNNGQAGQRAGWAFIYRPPDPRRKIIGHCSFRLENKGPTGEEYTQTSNRAELRAVIGALRFRAWNSEGFKSIVIATDSEYVVEGATNWIRGWLRRGWVKGDGKPVKNKDLWQALLGEAERLWEDGVTIRLWRIPRELNTAADERAKEAAIEDEVDEFADASGVLV